MFENLLDVLSFFDEFRAHLMCGDGLRDAWTGALACTRLSRQIRKEQI